MSSPPPPNPTTTTATTTTTTTTTAAGVFSNPPPQQPLNPINPAALPAFPPPTQRQQQTLYSNYHPQSAPGGILYPVASSGRGFLSKHQQPSSDQNAAVAAAVIANSGGFPLHPVSGYPYALHRPYGFSNSGISGQNLHPLVRPMPVHLQQPVLDRSMGVSVSANPKVVAPTSAADDNGFKDPRDKSGDDTFVVIRDRKVQVSEGTSLYAQCRSWLKNGLAAENQPQYVDGSRSLPRPLPASMVEVRKEDDQGKDEEKEEDVENLSEKELLQLHVKHAKKVRAGLRNKRLQRIERYKDRLALLLPPAVEQPQKNDSVS